MVEHEGAGQVEALQVGKEDDGTAPIVWPRCDAVRGVGQVQLLYIIHIGPELVIYRLQLPALVTPELAESGVLTEGVLVDSVQEDRADVQVLQVLGATEHISLHCPQVAAKIENTEAVHSLKAGDLQPKGGAADKDWPALEGEIKRVDERSSNSRRNSSQLILGKVEVFQNVELFEEFLIDDSD